MPLLMVALDPAVFRSTVFGVGTPILGRFKALGYVGIALGVGVLAFCLLSKQPRAALAGGLAGGCLFSVGLGIAILPFSLLGAIFFGVGLLGLSPFMSAVVFGWWARRIYRGAPLGHRKVAAVAGVLLFAAIPVGTQVAASAAYRSAVDDILSGRPRRLERGITRLEHWRLLVDADQMVMLWNQQTEETGRRELAAAYQRITGGDIASRASELVD